MQEQPELVGRRSCTGGPVGGKMRLPRLDVVLGRAAPAVDILVERLGLATCKVGDDEAGVGALGANLDARDLCRNGCSRVLPKPACQWFALRRGTSKHS